MVPAPTFAHLACDQSLTTSALELKYEKSTHLVNILSKDEDIRRLRFDVHILEDDNDELRELLAQEEDRSDAFERLVNENLARAEDAEAQLQELETDLRQREQELTSLLAEKDALKHSTQDATAALTEKLALTRELSALKPELAHLKAQAANTEELMTEKLALQRQITNVQCELEHAKREAQRALAKRRNTGVEIAQELQMDDLRKQLAKEKRARERAEEAADVSQSDLNVDEVRKELTREKRARQKAEEQLEEAQQNTQIEDVRKDLLNEKKAKQKLEDQLETAQAELEGQKKAVARASKRADGNAAADDQAEDLRNDLAKEKKARAAAERGAKQASDEWESQRATLDDKLNQFRNKLRTTKEKLKEAETELATARASTSAPAPAKKATAAKAPAAKAPAKATKKRNADTMDQDATQLGTPGDGPAAKRGRKAAAVGDKSTFSITPFLNRTMSAAPESGDEEEAASPAAKQPAKQPLATQPASKANVQPKKAAVQRKQKAPMLEMVTEEAEDVHTQGQENAGAKAAMKVKTKVADGPDDNGGAKKKKYRKSIHEFATFDAEPEIKKKRKLGGLGKTLFDEEEETAPKAMPGRALFGSKGFGAFGGGMGKKTGLLGAAKSKMGSTLLTAMDGSGFQFSPLKKGRRGLDDTLRG
ncbi:hypothetical protein LTR78_009504 [Recurvomyces mirabilis]|uniref:Uncharacterized protein n=1 Tax=Recurvomyces mirabilis TaxID=574656 RepID=A0AAE0TPI6_9PEZI|nr:hypothetical protein LTR78_009504 [Recurvomyces mirabilis]KAK5152408.1 hypothetical protein LTS14_008355 [Recurvomyces mirabilis]